MAVSRVVLLLICAAAIGGLAYVAAIVTMNYGVAVHLPHWLAHLISGAV